MIKSTPKTMSSAFTPLISAMSLPFAAGNTQPTAYNNMYQMLTRSLKEEVGAQKGLVHVSTPLLLASAIPLAIMAVIGHQIDPNLADSLGVGIVRSFVQLMMLGVILNPIFKWGMTKPWLVGLCKFVDLPCYSRCTFLLLRDEMIHLYLFANVYFQMSSSWF